MDITYRKLLPDDAGQYRNIRLECLKLHPASFDSVYEEQRRLPKLMFERALEQGASDRFIVGAFDRTNLIGICGFVEANDYNLPKTGTIIQMYVKAAYSGRKIGLQLIRAVIREALQRPGLDQIVLEVRAGNIPAIRVYEQAGFSTYQPEGHQATPDSPVSRVMILPRNV